MVALYVNAEDERNSSNSSLQQGMRTTILDRFAEPPKPVL